MYEMDSANQARAGNPIANFDRLADKIESNIQKITQNVSSMQKMLNQLNSSQESQELRNQYQHIQNYTQQMAQDTSVLLRSFMAITLPTDQVQRKLTRENLGEEFVAALGALQTTHRNAAQKTNEEVRKHKSQTAHLPYPYSSGSSNNELIEMEPSERKKQQQVQVPTEEELREYEEQQQRVLELEKNITDVNDIFKEFSTMVYDQANIVDSIEGSIENTVQHVESGVEQLRQASNSQNKLRRKKLYLIVIALVILAIILIIIFSR